MKRLIGSICVLLSIICLLAIGQSAQASAQFLGTGTATSSQQASSPTSTLGTPLPTGTPTETPSMTPTTTLAPLPAITLIFPASTTTATATITPTVNLVTETPNPQDGLSIISLAPRIRALAILLVILWVFLAGFVIIYVRQFR